MDETEESGFMNLGLLYVANILQWWILVMSTRRPVVTTTWRTWVNCLSQPEQPLTLLPGKTPWQVWYYTRTIEVSYTVSRLQAGYYTRNIGRVLYKEYGSLLYSMPTTGRVWDKEYRSLLYSIPTTGRVLYKEYRSLLYSILTTDNAFSKD